MELRKVTPIKKDSPLGNAERVMLSVSNLVQIAQSFRFGGCYLSYYTLIALASSECYQAYARGITGCLAWLHLQVEVSVLLSMVSHFNTQR